MMKKLYAKMAVAYSVCMLALGMFSPSEGVANTVAATFAKDAVDEGAELAIQKAKQLIPMLGEFVVKDIWKGKEFSRIRFIKPESHLTATIYYKWRTGEMYGAGIHDMEVYTHSNSLTNQQVLEIANAFLQQAQSIMQVDPQKTKETRIERVNSEVVVHFPEPELENTDYFRISIDHAGQVFHFMKNGFKGIDTLSPADFDEIANRTMNKMNEIFPESKGATIDDVIKGLMEYDPIDTWKVQSSVTSESQTTVYMVVFDSRTGEVFDAYQSPNPELPVTGLTSMQAIEKGKKILEDFYSEEAKVYAVKQITQDTQKTKPNSVHTVVLFEAPTLQKQVTIQFYSNGQMESLQKKVPLS